MYNLAQPFTIEFWLKVSDYNQNIVFSRKIGKIYYPNQPTLFKIYTQNGNIYAGYDGPNSTISSFFPVNEWHHVAVTYRGFDGSGIGPVFVIDGVSQGDQGITFSPENINNRLTIIGGTRIDTSSPVVPSFKGEIDEFRFWDIDLDPTDIQSRKDCEISNPAQFPILKDYYNFNQIFYGTDNNGETNATFVNSLGNSLPNVPARLFRFNLLGPDSNWVAGSPVGSGGCCNPAAPMAIVNDQFFCNAATAGNLTAIGTALQFYDSLAATTPMPPTQAIASGIYYVTQSSTGVASCKRAFRVTIDATPQAPTGFATQAFCSGATIANLQTTGNIIKWYAAATGGTALPTSTTLVNGTSYYASQTNSCGESTNRLSVTVAAPQGAALAFDGLDDYVTLNSINIANQSFSIEFWAKRGSVGAQFVVAKVDGFGNVVSPLIGFDQTDKLNFNFTPNILISTTSITDLNNWHHYACTYDKMTHIQSIYIDGVLSSSQIATNDLGTSFFRIGYNSNLIQRYKGSLDEFRIWNRALSATDIQSNKNCELPAGACGLIENLHFNQGVGGGGNQGINTVTDSSVNNSQRLLNGFALTCGNYTSNFIPEGAVASGVVCSNAVINNTVTQSLGVLTATQTGATYQWYQCPSTLISGETNQNFTPTAAGDYKVNLTIAGCIVTSSCITVSTLGNESFAFNSKLSVYPNPSSEVFYINSDSRGSFVVYNLIGKIIKTETIDLGITKLDLANYPSGIYLMKVTNDSNQTKTMKLIKQ